MVCVDSQVAKIRVACWVWGIRCGMRVGLLACWLRGDHIIVGGVFDIGRLSVFVPLPVNGCEAGVGLGIVAWGWGVGRACSAHSCSRFPHCVILVMLWTSCLRIAIKLS